MHNIAMCFFLFFFCFYVNYIWTSDRILSEYAESNVWIRKLKSEVDALLLSYLNLNIIITFFFHAECRDFIPYSHAFDYFSATHRFVMSLSNVFFSICMHPMS